MSTTKIKVNSAPDFVIHIYQIIHNHSVTISYDHPTLKIPAEVFSHRSQIEVVKFLKLRLLAHAVTASTTLTWHRSENLTAKI